MSQFISMDVTDEAQWDDWCWNNTFLAQPASIGWLPVKYMFIVNIVYCNQMLLNVKFLLSKSDS